MNDITYYGRHCFIGGNSFTKGHTHVMGPGFSREIIGLYLVCCVKHWNDYYAVMDDFGNLRLISFCYTPDWN